MPKAERKSRGEEEEDVPIHGATNEKEAKQYSSDLDTIAIQMGTEVNNDVQEMRSKMQLRHSGTGWWKCSQTWKHQIPRPSGRPSKIRWD